MKHTLKVEPPYFDRLLDGSKTFEVRVNDRAYQAGDVLDLREWDENHGAGKKNGNVHAESGSCCLTGRELTKTVTFVYSGDPRWGAALGPNVVVLALGGAS